MTIEEARDLLLYHNKWRRDNHVPNQYEMVNPTELGEAIDLAVESLNTLSFLNCKSSDDMISFCREVSLYRSKY